MDLSAAHGKLASTTAALEAKLREMAAFADAFAGGTHRVAPRVELDRYKELCADLDYALEEHAQARDAFLRILRGDQD